MRQSSLRTLFFSLVAALAVLCSCGGDGNAQQAAQASPKDKPAEKGQTEAKTLERISVSEMGKLRTRVGKEVIVYGKVADTSKSGSGHHFLNFPNGFKVVCLKDHVGKFSKGGPADLYRGKLIEVTGTLASHKGKPQLAIESPAQVKQIDLKGGNAPAKRFEMIEVTPGTWVTTAGLRYTGRDAQGLTRKAHVLRHAKDQPNRAGSHGVFDADGDEVFKVIDEAWGMIKTKNIRPNTEGDSQTYTIPMGRRVGYLGGKNGARRKHPALRSVFIVVRKGTKNVVTAFPR